MHKPIHVRFASDLAAIKKTRFHLGMVGLGNSGGEFSVLGLPTDLDDSRARTYYACSRYK